ncbi:MAG: GNAT family N-acetyltransferase [Acidimicrobiales bacterium]
MVKLVVAHTGQLEPGDLDAARNLLEEVFDGDLRDQDWEHSLGGMHALVWDGPDLIGHASLIQRRLLHRGRALRTGYVEGVGVRQDARRHGHATSMMAALERIASRAYEVAALGATEEAAAFYAARGWRLWRGTTSALTPDGVVRTPAEDDSIYVLPFTAGVDLQGELIGDWRSGDVW